MRQTHKIKEITKKLGGLLQFYGTSDPREQKQNVALLENATAKVLVQENYVISGLIYIIHTRNDLQSGCYSADDECSKTPKRKGRATKKHMHIQ